MGLRKMMGNSYNDLISVKEINAYFEKNKFIEKRVFDKVASKHAALKRKNCINNAMNLIEIESLENEIEKLNQELKSLNIEVSQCRALIIFQESGFSESDFIPFISVFRGESILKSEKLAREITTLLSAYKYRLEEVVANDIVKRALSKEM